MGTTTLTHHGRARRDCPRCKAQAREHYRAYLAHYLAESTTWPPQDPLLTKSDVVMLCILKWDPRPIHYSILIRECGGDTRHASVYSEALTRLQRDGLVEKVGHGIYRLAQASEENPG